MLELPEVITLSKQVNNALSGKTITQVFNATKPHKFTFYNGNPSEYGKLLVGKTILSSEGYGMFVNFNLSDNVIMNIGDGVSVRYYSAGDEIPANYQLLLTFNDDSFLVFTVAMINTRKRNLRNSLAKQRRPSLLKLYWQPISIFPVSVTA